MQGGKKHNIKETNKIHCLLYLFNRFLIHFEIFLVKIKKRLAFSCGMIKE